MESIIQTGTMRCAIFIVRMECGRANPVKYEWNFYEKCATEKHPFDKNKLVFSADGSKFFTARDANCHLLFDWNQDGEIDTTDGGYAFFEHNGRGKNGMNTSISFTNFWFDDNWLARYMSNAYDRPAPNGLSERSGFVRWNIMGGDRKNWTPYSEDPYLDQLALNGLYHLAGGDVASAINSWNRIRDLSGYTYDVSNQRYTYPKIKESYHMGLFHILTSFLMDTRSIDRNKSDELLSHWVSLRSHILSTQEWRNQDGKDLFFGWRSYIDLEHDGNLMNTETISVNVLALGAGVHEGYEAGKAPLSMEQKNYFFRPHNVLSAVKGLSQAGFMTYGPYRKTPIGVYEVDFFLRSPSPQGNMASLDVYDAQNNRVLATTSVHATHMRAANEWTKVTLRFSVENASNLLEYRTYWSGAANMDVATIRVRKLEKK